MEFLSNLTMVQRAGGAGVLVLLLVLLLVKQRQAQAAPAGATKDKKSKSEKTAKTPKASKGSSPKAKKSISLGRGKKAKAAEQAAEAAEPKATSGRMVPRLPSAGDTPALDVPAMETPMADVTPLDDAGSALLEPMAATVDHTGAMISEPGWPTPGEVWAAPGANDAHDETETWSSDDEDPHDALNAAPDTDATEWATGDASFDPTAGWDTAGDAPVAEPVTAEWAAPTEEEFDWAAGDQEAWTTSEATPDVVAEVEAPVEDTPAWDVSSDADETPSWVASDAAWDLAEAAEAESTDSAVAVQEAPVDEEIPAIVWEPVDEVEAREEEVVVAEVEEPVVDVSDWTVATSDEPVEAVAETAVDEVVVPTSEPVLEPVAEVVEAPVAEPVVDVIPEIAVEVVETPAVEAPMVHAPVVEVTMDVPVVEVPEVAVDAEFEMATAVASTDPAARWAAMAPGGKTAPAADPVASWARLQPSAPVTSGTVAVAAGPVTVTPSLPEPSVATAASLAWWDVPAAVESDPRRGRFALGGYALQAGHQVVSGVTFRDAVVPPPSHWVIGPVVGQVAPGTLVLNVDGCLNCTPQDLAVLTDPGFAPTTEGFSLRLVAAATGPFAVSGTYVIS